MVKHSRGRAKDLLSQGMRVRAPQTCFASVTGLGPPTGCHGTELGAFRGGNTSEVHQRAKRLMWCMKGLTYKPIRAKQNTNDREFQCLFQAYVVLQSAAS